MATLTVRDLPDDVHDALRRRAAEHRRSVEAEVRELLARAVDRPTDEQRRAAIARLHRMSEAVGALSKTPDGWSSTDAFLAERRLEAAWEDGRVTDAERLDWMARLERFEATPDTLEAFVLSRTPPR
ncbi:hypothetical protein [Phenylobacterium sp.]|uniref:FitA-like ribbon-helix-helix domain-containing protein n=1 Tax=Phenylobacterium sp. TaxID=1871053 RepID=UPI0025E54045|nr:hypothetical protein [Phenylobacterium sp.]MBX3483792.1 hypothetical protein [Phenylobacterium sp.]MCW5758624.1 hypothetical protein [Phenylobacterium sp.]